MSSSCSCSIRSPTFKLTLESRTSPPAGSVSCPLLPIHRPAPPLRSSHAPLTLTRLRGSPSPLFPTLGCLPVLLGPSCTTGLARLASRVTLRMPRQSALTASTCDGRGTTITPSSRSGLGRLPWATSCTCIFFVRPLLATRCLSSAVGSGGQRSRRLFLPLLPSICLRLPPFACLTLRRVSVHAATLLTPAAIAPAAFGPLRRLLQLRLRAIFGNPGGRSQSLQMECRSRQ
jgi:hypothetical protein